VEGGIGRDRLEPDQLEQPLQAPVEVLVDGVEDGRECGHGRTFRFWGGGRSSARPDRKDPGPESQKNAAVVEGEPRRRYSKLDGSPERGMRLPPFYVR